MTPKKWVIFFIAATLVMIIGFLYQKHYGGSSSSATINKLDATVAARGFVKKQLKTPSSAKFPWGEGNVTSNTATGQYTIRSYVDAQNYFGVMIRMKYTCSIQYDSAKDQWVLKSLTFQ